MYLDFFFFSSRRRHTRWNCDWSSDVCSSDLPAPMDFSAWFEAYLGDRWYTFDARHNNPRIGRILMARGRDATDVALVTSFGPCTLASFKVITEEVTPASTTSRL